MMVRTLANDPLEVAMAIKERGGLDDGAHALPLVMKRRHALQGPTAVYTPECPISGNISPVLLLY